QLEHLALALIEEQDVKDSLLQCNAPIQDIIEYLRDQLRAAPKFRHAAEPRLTSTLQKVVNRAAQQVASSQKSIVESHHMMSSLLLEDDSPAAYAFTQYGIDRVRFLRGI